MKKSFFICILALFAISAKSQYIDLGLPSGILWNSSNEDGFYTQDEALEEFGNNLPLEVNFKELLNYCSWIWTGNGFKVVGKNGASIFLPANGFIQSSGSHVRKGISGTYWGRDVKYGEEYDTAACLVSTADERFIAYYSTRAQRSVRLIKRP